jgi:hypothetical protein
MVPLQIVGVAQEGLTGTEPGRLTDLWIPNMMKDRERLESADWNWFRVWGRLKPGTAPEPAREVLQAAFAAFRRERAQTFPADEARERVARYIASPSTCAPPLAGPRT